MVKTNVEQKQIQLKRYSFSDSILFLFGEVPPDKLAGVFLSTFKLKKVSWGKEKYFLSCRVLFGSGRVLLDSIQFLLTVYISYVIFLPVPALLKPAKGPYPFSFWLP